MKRYLAYLWFLLLWGSSAAISFSQTSIRLEDVTDATGVDFVHNDGSSGQHFLVETLSTGMALIDYDGDLLPDIYFLNGAALPGADFEVAPTNRLFRNNGDWTFTDVTESAGVGDAGYGLGVVCADYDQDGDEDIYVANFGANVFYVNNGDGTFREATDQAKLACDRFGAGAAFADIDQDGDLDLYAANYVKYGFEEHEIRMIGSHEFHPGPHDYKPEFDRLFRNNGDGTFEDISEAAGITVAASTGMGVIATDVERDGDIDFFVANDSRPSFLWINDGSGNFTEEAVLLGVAFDQAGNANGNMGVEPLDFDADGNIDLFTTTYQDEMPVLYQNLGGLFQDVTRMARIDRTLVAHVNWGIGAEDFDNDADKDLLVACGHFMDNIQYIDDRTRVKVANYMLENKSGRFLNVSSKAGSAFATIQSSRSACFEDLDGDGDIDGVIQNFRDRPSILRNELGGKHNWLRVQLVGREDNRGGVGALVTVSVDGRQQVAEVYAGRGYQSSYGRHIHFGLGTQAKIDFVEVRWPNQTRERFAVEVNQLLRLVQGDGTPVAD